MQEKLFGNEAEESTWIKDSRFSLVVFVYEVNTHLKELSVDLELGYGAALLLSSLTTLLDALEEMVDGSRDDAQLLICDVNVKASPHRVGLP